MVFLVDITHPHIQYSNETSRLMSRSIGIIYPPTVHDGEIPLRLMENLSCFVQMDDIAN
jgi:hypothetical protein